MPCGIGRNDCQTQLVTDALLALQGSEAQQYRASGLNLVIAAIVYWNTTYMAEAVEHLRQAGEIVPVDLLAHTSPIGWEHIAFSGDFLWERAAAASGRKALILPRRRAQPDVRQSFSLSVV